LKDLDRNGIISFTEFLAASFEAIGHLEEEKLADTFHSLDFDKTGFISNAVSHVCVLISSPTRAHRNFSHSLSFVCTFEFRKNLRAVLGKDYSAEKVAELIREGDGKLISAMNSS